MISVKVNPAGVRVPARCVACYEAPVTDHIRVGWSNAKGSSFLHVNFPLCAECSAAMRLVQPKGDLHPGLGLRLMHGKLTDEQWERASRASSSVKVSLVDPGVFKDKVLVASFANSSFAEEFDTLNKQLADFAAKYAELQRQQAKLADLQRQEAKLKARRR